MGCVDPTAICGHRNGRKHPEIIHSFSPDHPQQHLCWIDAWENIQRDPNDNKIWIYMACNLRKFSNFMPLFGVSRKKLCGTETKAEGLQKPRNLSSKTVAYVEYPGNNLDLALAEGLPLSGS